MAAAPAAANDGLGRGRADELFGPQLVALCAGCPFAVGASSGSLAGRAARAVVGNPRFNDAPDPGSALFADGRNSHRHSVWLVAEQRKNHFLVASGVDRYWHRPFRVDAWG